MKTRFNSPADCEILDLSAEMSQMAPNSLRGRVILRP